MYRSVVADPNNLVSDRLKAQERIDKLLGLEVKEAGVGVIVNNVNAVGVAIDQTLQRLKDDELDKFLDAATTETGKGSTPGIDAPDPDAVVREGSDLEAVPISDGDGA